MEWHFFSQPKRTNRPEGDPECGEIEPLLSLYSDGMTSAAESQRVDAHLAACENCRKAYFWMRATHDVIAQRPAQAPPVDMLARIQAAIAAEASSGGHPAPSIQPSPVRMRFHSRRSAYAAAASIALAFLAIIPVTRLLHPREGHSVTVAVNPPAERPSAALKPASPSPVVLPPSPHRTSTVARAVARPKIAHPDTMVASTAHEPRRREEAPVERHLVLPKPSVPVVPHSDRSLIAKAMPVHSEPLHPAAAHASEVAKVARLEPKRIEPRAPIVVRPAPEREPEKVAMAPTAPETSSPVHTEAAVPQPQPVAMAVSVRRPAGLNDMLRAAVLTIHKPAADTPHSVMISHVRVAYDPSIPIVSQ